MIQRCIELQWVSSIYLSIHSSSIYFTVLHPSYKLQYFENANWDQEWIETAREIVINEYERRYAQYDNVSEEEVEEVEKPSVRRCLYTAYNY